MALFDRVYALSWGTTVQRKKILHIKSLGYLRKTNTIVLTFLPAVNDLSPRPLAPLLAKIAYLPILFILQLTHPAKMRIDIINKKTNFTNDGASK